MKEILLIGTMWVVTVCTYISYVPQIVKLIQTKQSEDLSIMSWTLWLLSAVCNTVYSLLLLRTELIVASVSEMLLILTTLALTLYYKYNRQKNNLDNSDKTYACLGEGRGSKAYYKNNKEKKPTKTNYHLQGEKSEGTREIEALIDQYLTEYGGIGNVDVSVLFENYPDLSWPDLHTDKDMSDYFNEKE